MSPEIVLGPPGTGKTTTLIGLVEEELGRGVPPDRIGYISFTRKATEEARGRATAKFNLTAPQLPYFRTIHSLCFWAMGMSSADVLEGRKLGEFGDWIGIRVTGRFSIEEGDVFGFEPGDRCLAMIGRARVMCIPLRQLYDMDDDGLQWQMLERVERGLLAYKQANRLHDYTDMLELFVRSDWRARLDVLLVDEAQDLSALQWQVVEKLAANCRRVVIAGDDDQAIYRWAGADVDRLVDMPGQVRVLSQSWRVPSSVQILSDEVIRTVKHRREKQWRARDEVGAVERVQSMGEVDMSGQSVLVLSRNICFLKDLEEELRRDGIVYEIRGAPSVKRSLLEAVVAWEDLRRGQPVSAARALHVYEYMSSGVGVARGHKRLPGLPRDATVTLESLRESGGLLRDDIWHDALDRITADERAYLLRALRRGEKLLQKPRVRLSTIHGAKGGEADHVVLLRDMAWRTSEQAKMLPEDEARVWYVAVTRAREKLTVVAPQTRMNFFL